MRSLCLSLAATLVLSMVGQASAGSIFDFNMDAVHPAGASISYAGGSNPLIGSNLSVDTVTGLDTPLNNGGTLGLTGGILSFTTGNLVGSDAGHWYFAGGGTISITTTAPIVPGASSTIFSGSFDSAEVDLSSGVFKVAIAAYSNSIDSKLAGYFGVTPGASWNGNLNLSFLASGTPASAFRSSKVLSGDLATNAVPEPSSALLGGLGIIAVGLMGARRRRTA
jgi:hypothetical protein